MNSWRCPNCGTINRKPNRFIDATRLRKSGIEEAGQNIGAVRCRACKAKAHSESLLEGLYYGWRAGKDAARNAMPVRARLKRSIPDWVEPAAAEEFDPVLIQQDVLTIQSTMWNYAGVIRTRKRLVRALADLNYLRHRVEQFYREARLSRAIIELRNATLAAHVIVAAAYSNGTSRGCHYIEN